MSEYIIHKEVPIPGQSEVASLLRTPADGVDRKAGDEVTHSMDQWPGYEMERRRVLNHFHEQRVSNPVVLTGDMVDGSPRARRCRGVIFWRSNGEEISF